MDTTTSEGLIYRVQDAEGRGPWRPGFSRQWSDREGWIPPAFWKDFGWDLTEVVRRVCPGEFHGTGCRTLDGLTVWFSLREIRKLTRFGYHIVSFVPDRVIGESAYQVFFARRLPLRDGVVVVPWALLVTAHMNKRAAASSDGQPIGGGVDGRTGS